MDTEYIISQENRTDYNIIKFLNGEVSSKYTVIQLEDKLQCSCMSGIYRGYCKHKDWIHNIKTDKKLPYNVSVQKQITQEDLNELVSGVINVK